MYLLRTLSLFKIATLSLYFSWSIAQESECQSHKHHLILKKMTKAIVLNKKMRVIKCKQLVTINIRNSKIETKNYFSLKE
ncbi:hypothetical protein BIY24_11965 [Halobacteriovorax marinus]|uniref:hypothetical protein n=1 Tax=Halobacteriovorax marinus TaxID=97084 RepID=UPI000BC3430D|nr:hypothetical protein [Halobacteriovorax marinus]ATH08635.1 hypothetical protein BIY24_11965 [Halobacteriovorax marinus]